MTYEQLIRAATADHNPAAAWQLVLPFEPLINRHAYDFRLKRINEDLKSEMQLILFLRIMRNYKIQEAVALTNEFS